MNDKVNLITQLIEAITGQQKATVAPYQIMAEAVQPGIVAPNPATISPDLNNTRDRYGSGMGGLMHIIGVLNGSGETNGYRPAVPYQQGSGQSAETATYGSGGGDYGSSPGQMTAGLAPGQRVFDTDSGSWGLKR